MTKYFRVFKFTKDNIGICTMIYRSVFAKVFLEHFLTAQYDFRVGTLFVTSGYANKDDYPNIKFYRADYDFTNLIGKWCSIIINDIAKEPKSIILESLYNELGSLENPEENQIACYTYLINLVNEQY